MAKHALPNLAPLAGATLPGYLQTARMGTVEAKYVRRLLCAFPLVLLGTPLRGLERVTRDRTAKGFTPDKPPLFIIGHWRSGTTAVHNLLCQDPKAGYLTTYHAVFPNNLASKWLFKSFMYMGIPEKRPADNLPMHPNYPQEDEFALANSSPISYYNMFYFPRAYKDIYRRTVDMEVPPEELARWKATYRLLINKAVINTHASRAVIKNPVNTGRIRHLIDLYPDAKFLFLHRHPVEVFLSSRRFFGTVIPSLFFHHVDMPFIEEMILDVYDKIMNAYLRDRSAIPHGNLMELPFDRFDKHPLEASRAIYETLLQEDFDPVKPYFFNQLDRTRNYKKSRNQADEALQHRIADRWGPHLRRWGYTPKGSLMSAIY